ncbi:hypothetical protein K432DRAFT_386487 [Lepidopterella palustris CBS 459.81]|uniref:Uncharacterized protein n=1 Tax=Lepidopterella palustris CBS 459.81 TaxID=1314670 RepID=A0A8E2E0C3_9PEZI|nr:hypothetical protein K432DRAFT_386487 [Lepidopterella palustris CBS 459.81]
MASGKQYGFNGNQDVYGIGIRVGYYTQALSVWAANRFLPEEAPFLQSVNILFMTAMILGIAFLCREPSNTYAVEPFLLIQITYLVAYIGTNTHGRSLRCSNDHRPDGFPWAAPVKAQLMQGICFIGLDAFSIWFWFVGMDQMKQTMTPKNTTTVYWLYTSGNLFGWVRMANMILCFPWILGRCLRFSIHAVRGFQNHQLDKVTKEEFMIALEIELRNALRRCEDGFNPDRMGQINTGKKLDEDEEGVSSSAAHYGTQAGQEVAFPEPATDKSDEYTQKRSVRGSISCGASVDSIKLNEDHASYSGPTRVNTVNQDQETFSTTNMGKDLKELTAVASFDTSAFQKPRQPPRTSQTLPYDLDTLISANTYITRLYPPPSPLLWPALRLPYTVLTHLRNLPRLAPLIYHIPTHPSSDAPGWRRVRALFIEIVRSVTPQLPHLLTFVPSSYSHPPLSTWPALAQLVLTYPTKSMPAPLAIGIVQRMYLTSRPPPPPPRKAIIGDAIMTASMFLQLLISTELTIQWNYILGVQSLMSVGQLIPFSLGVGALVKVAWGAVFAGEYEGCGLLCSESKKRREWETVSQLFFELVERRSIQAKAANGVRKEEEMSV